ncbi:GNAT family N-acetyltransferase [Afifella marina]|uniref:Ribosomal protein S18 acetylase RimI n=1 Tax=Afifella marina DSM 2698 TaxID=1120955 RepID=A0A1G5P6T5_AFIMA|nr:GNAT family N-acetyltransferase [Afifella marina]MBK1624860.1 GNAT family N-acetyltransferase [Afifella marina DSM 2698]MBK1628454.1 GNAT family N-acetyltransferase [Afifella marina]MBK5917941.1 hypothetical protein [Afifella marina]RAI18722.1 hypothetical protein CH311_14705 [Afifella marina DSM 2698]SCZ45272.1 Ribosomal protein S18 acetylase RimI [Afifella marina DSM 2698]
MTRLVPTTITDLRMSAPPRHLPPPPAGIRLALMRAENCPLHFYRYLYATIGRSYLWVERHGLDDATLAERIHGDGIEVWVLYGNGAPAGFFELNFADPTTVDLVYFGLMPDWKGRRIGPWLLGTAVNEAFSRGAEAVTVNTCTMDHPAALPLYQRLGFEAVGRREHQLPVPEGFTLPTHVPAANSP